MTTEGISRVSVNPVLIPLESKWEWQQQGLCRTSNPEDFFIDYEAMPKRLDQKAKEIAAVAICNTCPVRLECLNHAISVPEVYGIWGGLTEKQRRRLARQGRP